MAIDQTNVVDSIGIEPNKDEAHLIISDHFDWGRDDQTEKEHMYLLQEKINTYLRFIESGEIYAAYPKARGRRPVIRVVGKYEMSSNAESFFKKIKEVLWSSGYAITFERLRIS
jgi:hypothetical protein